MNFQFRRLGESELLPRYIFAENLVARRRVLEIGAVAATGGQSAHFLAERGARSVLACDADLAAVEAAQSRFGTPQLSFRSLVFHDLSSASFDLILVADFGEILQSPQLLLDLRRLVTPQGYVLGGLRNPGGLALAQVMDPEGADAPPTYGQLFDALSAHFEHIEVATQSPILGYQLAFHDTEGLQIDGSLASSGEAAYYVVLAGHEPLRTLDPTWVQLPPAPIAFNGGRLEEFAQRSKNWEERTSRLKTAVEKLRQELDAQTAANLELKGRLERTLEESARTTAQLDNVRSHPQKDRDELAVRLRKAEAELRVALERAEDGERRLSLQKKENEEAIGEVKQATAAVLAAQENARVERARREDLGAQLEDARARQTATYAELEELQEVLGQARLSEQRARQENQGRESELEGLRHSLALAKERELRLADQQGLLHSAIDHQKAEISALQAELGDQRRKSGELEETLARVERTAAKDVQAAKTAQERLAAARAALEAQQSEGQARIHALETELAGAMARLEKAAAELSTAVSDRESLQALAEDLQERLARAENDFQALKDQSSLDQEDAEAQREELTHDVEVLETQLASAKETSEALAQALEAEREDTQRFTRATEVLKTQLATAGEELVASREALATAQTNHERALANEHDKRAVIERQTAHLRSELSSAQVQLQSLENGRDTLQAELQRQTKMLAALEETQAELRSQLTAAQTESATLKAELLRVEQARAEVEQQRAEEQKRLLQLQQQLVEAQVVNAQAATELNQLREAHAQEEQAAAQLKQRLVEERDQGKQAVTALQQQFAQARAQAEQSAAQLQQQLAEEQAQAAQAVARLQQTLSLAQAQSAQTVAQLQQQLAAAQAQQQALSEALQAESAALAHERSEVQAAKNESQRLEASLHELRREGQNAQAQWHAAEGTAASLKAELEMAKQSVTSLQAQLEQTTARASDQAKRSEARGVALESQIQGLQTQLSEERQQSERQSHQLQTLQDSLETTQKALEAADAERERLQASVEDASAHRMKVEVDLRAVQDRWEHAESQRRTLEQHDVPELRSKVEGLEVELRSIDEERRKALTEIERLEDDRSRLTQERETLSHTLESEREVLRNELETVRLEVSGLRGLATEAIQREDVLKQSLQDREKKLDLFQRRVTAQESELRALRRLVGKTSPPPVQQIFERANEQLTAVKDELSRRPKVPAATPVPPLAKQQKADLPDEGEEIQVIDIDDDEDTLVK